MAAPGLSPSISAAVAARLDELNAAERDVVVAANGVGPPFRLVASGTACGQDEDAVTASLANGLALSDQHAVALQAVDLDAAGHPDDAGLIFAGGEVAGLGGGAWAGPVGPIADEEGRVEDLE